MKKLRETYEVYSRAISDMIKTSKHKRNDKDDIIEHLVSPEKNSFI